MAARNPTPERTNSLLRIVALVVLWACATMAQSATLIGVISETSPDDRKPAEHLLQQLAAQNDTWLATTAASLPAAENPNTIFVAFGPQALGAVLKRHVRGPILALYCDYSTYDELLSRANHPKNVTAIYSNPDPLRQLVLIKVLFGPSARVTIWSTAADTALSRTQQHIASALDLSVKIISLDRGSSLRTALSTLENSNVLYFDRRIAVENKIPIDQLLIQTYDLYQTGIVGYSPAVVKAGALATTYASDDDIESAASLVLTRIKMGAIPPAHYPAGFHISVNRYLARSMNLAPPDDTQIRNQIDIRTRQYRGEGGQSN